MMIANEIKALLEEKNQEYKDLARVIKSEPHNKMAKKKIENTKKTLDLLYEITEFINGCTWLRSDAATRYKHYLQYGKRSLIHLELESSNITPKSDNFDFLYANKVKTIKVILSEANKRLRTKIGTETINLIKDGQISEAKACFYLASGKARLSDYLDDVVLEGLPRPNREIKYRYTITDCLDQIDYLYNHSKYKVERDKSEVLEQNEKMSWVLNEIKEGNTKILGLIMGKVDYQYIIDEIKNKHEI